MAVRTLRGRGRAQRPLKVGSGLPPYQYLPVLGDPPDPAFADALSAD